MPADSQLWLAQWVSMRDAISTLAQYTIRYPVEVFLAVIILGAIWLLIWGNLSTIRLFRPMRAGGAWWIFLGLLWVAGLALGVYGGFFFVYRASPTLQIFGAPVPTLFLHWEGPAGHQQWVDFPADTALLNAFSNVLLLPLLLAGLFGPVFWTWTKVGPPRPSGDT